MRFQPITCGIFSGEGNDGVTDIFWPIILSGFFTTLVGWSSVETIVWFLLLCFSLLYRMRDAGLDLA